jgi:hypothetical protein
MALAGCGDSPSAPGRAVTRSLNTAAGAEVSRSSTHESFPNRRATTCGGEPVTMTLVIDSQQHTTTLASGERMFTQQIRLSVDGVVTTTGARYIGHGIINTTQVFATLPEGGTTTFTQVFRVQNVVQGSADNDVVVLHTKWTINSNGQPVDLQVITEDPPLCRG